MGKNKKRQQAQKKVINQEDQDLQKAIELSKNYSSSFDWEQYEADLVKFR